MTSNSWYTIAELFIYLRTVSSEALLLHSHLLPGRESSKGKWSQVSSTTLKPKLKTWDSLVCSHSCYSLANEQSDKCQKYASGEKCNLKKWICISINIRHWTAQPAALKLKNTRKYKILGQPFLHACFKACGHNLASNKLHNTFNQKNK